MSDEWDVGVDAEIEDRLLRSSEREERRLREALVFTVEVGDRAALRSTSFQRDLRWFRGLFGMRIG